MVSWPLKDINVISFEKKVKPLYSGHLLIADTFLCPDGVCCREVLLYYAEKKEIIHESVNLKRVVYNQDIIRTSDNILIQLIA